MSPVQLPIEISPPVTACTVAHLTNDLWHVIQNLMGTLPCCYSSTGHQIATNFANTRQHNCRAMCKILW